MTQPLTAGLPYHQVDAFTHRAFSGNPAAVYVLEDWLDDARMQAIAGEHNLSETVVCVPSSASAAHLRWFTPTCEVELCGHATLATAHVLLTERTDFTAPLRFSTEQAGTLVVERLDGRLWLDLPADAPTPCDTVPDGMAAALGAEPAAWLVASNYLAVFDDPETVENLTPDNAALARALAGTNRGVIVTAAQTSDPDDEREASIDFVSRYFAPAHGIAEDPVTGSAHCTLAPYWGQRLGRSRLTARQVSSRGGELVCESVGDRVHVGGDAVTVAAGMLFLNTAAVAS